VISAMGLHSLNHRFGGLSLCYIALYRNILIEDKVFNVSIVRFIHPRGSFVGTLAQHKIYRLASSLITKYYQITFHIDFQQCKWPNLFRLMYSPSTVPSKIAGKTRFVGITGQHYRSLEGKNTWVRGNENSLAENVNVSDWWSEC
jgi:hypothetical protein